MKRIRSTIGGALAAVACVGVSVVPAAQSVSAATSATVTCDPIAPTEAAPEVDLVSFDPMLPERIVDTRDGTGGVDAALGAGCTLIIDTSGIGPAEATAFALSVTVISPVKGFFTAFPCAAGLPGTSSVNARAGFPTPNLVVATPDSGDRVCLYSNRGGHVVVDVSGWWADGPNRFTPIDPVRAYDTRELAEPVKLPADAIRAVDVGGAFVPDDAVAVTVNLAAVAPETRGFLVVYPCGLPAPLASNLNFKAGEKRAASAIVEIGSVDAAAAGKVCVTGNADTHFLLDVTGYIAPSSPTSPDLVLTPLPDERVVDTRDATVAGVRFAAGVPQEFDLGASVDRPDDMVAAVLNVVAVQADRARVRERLSVSDAAADDLVAQLRPRADVEPGRECGHRRRRDLRGHQLVGGDRDRPGRRVHRSAGFAREPAVADRRRAVRWCRSIRTSPSTERTRRCAATDPSSSGCGSDSPPG